MNGSLTRTARFRLANRGLSGLALALTLAALAGLPGCGTPESRDADKPEAEKPEAEQAETAPAETEAGALEAADGPGEARDSLSPPGALPGGVLAQVGAGAGDRDLAEHYYRTGKRYFDQQDFQRAYDNLKRAVSLDPSHVDATRLYYDAGSVLGVRQEELKATLERYVEEQQVKVQLLQQEMRRFYGAGEKAFNEADHEQAIKDLERVVQIIAFAPYEIDDGDYKRRSEKLIAEAKVNKLKAELERQNELEQEMIERARSEEQVKQLREKDRVGVLLKQAANLVQARRYKQAEKLVGEILDLDPRNPMALKLREFARLGLHTLKNEEIFSDWSESMWSMEQKTEFSGIPREYQPIIFPDDWLERTKNRRPGIGTSASEEPFWVRNTKRILRDREVSLNFPDVPLQDVIGFLQEISGGLNFVIHPDIDAESLTVSLKLKNIKLENALRIILDHVGLDYVFKQQAIIIIEPGSQVGETYFDVYNIDDLIFAIKDFKAPRMRLPDPDDSTGSGGGGGGSLIFGGDDEDEGEPITGETLAEVIISATGGDDVWGDTMTIEAHKGQLLVQATREKHEQVLEVLDNLRANQGWFVEIETRFIDITNDMLEDFGIDFRGLGGNPGDTAAAGGTHIGGPIDAFQGDPNSGGRNLGGNDAGVVHDPTPNGQVASPQGNLTPGFENFVWRTQHVFGNNFGPVAGQRLQGGGGLTLEISKLDPFQINALLRAEYQSSKVHQLTAPRVTAANRERVYISVVTQRAYIADYELISGGTGLAVIEVPDPIIETLEEGVVLEVRPTISSDRKYVTLDCRPSLASLVGGNIATVIVNLGTANMTAIGVPIGVPQISLQEAFTSVTIPDGGTALLGGFRSLNERTEENSIPFLDNIPLLNVLFRRKAEVREMRNLVILVTAKILNIREEERTRYNSE
ncbi:MAG: hypothetical protein ACYTFT_01700 [Planctomycetota bacterium]